MDNHDISVLFNKTLSIANEISIYFKKNSDSHTKIIRSRGYDVTLQADLSLNKFISKSLYSISSLPVVSEETIHIKKSDLPPDSPYWLIDPIDGSANLSRGLPFVYSSIALVNESGHPVIGIIVDLLDSKVYSARCSSIPSLSLDLKYKDLNLKEVVLATGFPLLFPDECLYRFVKELRCFKKVRMYGSAVGSLKLLLEGKVDIYVELGILPWDIAGIVPLLISNGVSCYIHKPRTNSLALDVVASYSVDLISSIVNSLQLCTFPINTLSLARHE